jgi:hypothetical protein
MKMKTSESIAEIAKALGTFQSKVKQPEKDGNNPHFKSKYVTLDGTVKAIHDCAPGFGLSYTQMPVSNENGVGVVTVIFHESGQFIEFDPFILPLEKKTAQGVGSATTYARRYSLSAAFGIVSDLDDDGNEATDNAPAQKAQLATPKQLGLIDKLLNDVATSRGIGKEEAYKTIRHHLKKDMEWFTPADASKAIEILNNALKQGA